MTAAHAATSTKQGLNDTKEIYAIIYINTLIITVLIVTEFALKGHRDAYVTLYGLAIFAEATLFLALTFIPKVRVIMQKNVYHNRILSFKSIEPQSLTYQEGSS